MAAVPNAARLQAIGSKTLTLAMERQRLLSISPPSKSILSPVGNGGNNSSVTTIVKNLTTLRDGILSIEDSQGATQQTRGLREQYESILSVLGEEDASAAGLQSLPLPPKRHVEPLLPAASTPPLSSSPFQDNPQQSDQEMFSEQTQIMRDQDTQLETLSHSIGRQHHLSLQINDELGEQVGLLDGLDEDLDRTGMRMSRAQRTLDKVSQGAKDNCSTMSIGIVILILLLLIIIFKT